MTIQELIVFRRVLRSKIIELEDKINKIERLIKIKKQLADSNTDLLAEQTKLELELSK